MKSFSEHLNEAFRTKKENGYAVDRDGQQMAVEFQRKANGSKVLIFQDNGEEELVTAAQFAKDWIVKRDN